MEGRNSHLGAAPPSTHRNPAIADNDHDRNNEHALNDDDDRNWRNFQEGRNGHLCDAHPSSHQIPSNGNDDNNLDNDDESDGEDDERSVDKKLTVNSIRGLSVNM